MHRAVVLVLSVTLLKVAGTGALRGVTLLVSPPIVERGKDLELLCNYDLQGAPLYSIKFYRGVHEFYRFSPFDNPPVKLFPFPGLQVDLSQPQDNRVLIHSVDYTLAGNVSCEISTDAPQFSTSIATQCITVVELPRMPPWIEVDAAGPPYEAGDRLRASCSSYPAQPAPSLTWFINDEPAMTNSTLWNHTDRLETRKVSLDLILLPRHVSSGSLTLRCSALVASIYKETVSLTLSTIGPGEPKHDRVRFSPANHPQLVSSALVLSFITLFSLR